MTASHAIFRADASVAQGLGHFMRCRALAEEWMARGGRATFVTTCTPQDLQDHLQDQGFGVRTFPSAHFNGTDELVWLASVLQEERPAVLVLDGYQFDLHYQQAVRPWVKCLVCLDDVPERPFACDVFLNQNLGVTAEEYKSLVPHGTTVLLGPRYALLRSEFREHAGSYRAAAKPRRVLVTLGGSDEADHTARVLGELASLAEIEMDVMLGLMYPHGHPIGRIRGLDPRLVHVNRGVDRLVDLAVRADLAVTAGGSTVWELACLGIPMVVLGTAANQDAVLRGLQTEQAALVLGPMQSLSPGEIAEAVRSLLAAPSRLRDLSRAASRLVDGRGSERVIEVIQGILARSVSRPGASAGFVKS
jgi:UDP-2,4-diacetamido-2,4,6-trideoxy-beta-L-altropyranose hydrolase